MPLPVTDGALVKEVVATRPTTALGMENEPLNGSVAEEVRPVVKDAQLVSPSASLAIQDLETLQPPVPQDPNSVQIPSPTKTVTLEPATDFALGKESLGVCPHLHE